MLDDIKTCHISRYVILTMEQGGRHVNLWEAFSGKGLGRLVEILGKMNDAMYKDILLRYWREYVGHNYLFQYDKHQKYEWKPVKQSL